MRTVGGKAWLVSRLLVSCDVYLGEIGHVNADWLRTHLPFALLLKRCIHSVHLRMPALSIRAGRCFCLNVNKH